MLARFLSYVNALFLKKIKKQLELTVDGLRLVIEG